MAATVASASLESSSDAAPSAKIRTCADARVTIAGTRGDDRIVADDESDVIRAGRGDDVIEAGAGTDRICGGPSEDEIDGGEGSDRVRGGAADDLIRGGEGNDELTGLGGTDEAEGGAGIDGCVVESHTQCEADLQVSGSVQLPVIGGALIPARLDVSNLGPTAATNARATAVARRRRSSWPPRRTSAATRPRPRG